MIFAIIVATIILAIFVLRHDNAPTFEEAPDAWERPAPVLSRREREDYQMAALRALDAGDVARARRLWAQGGGEGFEKLLREGEE